MLSFLAILIASYLLGSLPTSILIGKLLRGSDFDIRAHGSGNAGGTNVLRVLGWKAGLVVMFIDAFKGFAATFWVAKWEPFGPTPLDFEVRAIVCGVAAVIGHIWTVFADFRGGKGVGTATGMVVALYPVAALICFVIFAAVVYFTRYVSLGSLTAAACLPLILWLGERFFMKQVPAPMFQFSLVVVALIFYTHRQNIRRLLAGTENRFGQKSPAPASSQNAEIAREG